VNTVRTPGTAVSILSSGRFAADLVEEIEEESDLADRGIVGTTGSLQYSEAFAVGMDVEG